VFATHNSGGLQQVTGQIVLKVASQPPPAGGSFAFTVSTTNLPSVGGVFQIGVSQFGNMTFRLSNSTNIPAQVAIDFTPKTQTGWVIKPPTGVDLTNQTIPALNHQDYLFQFGAPTSAAQSLVFALTAKDNAQNVLAQTQVTIST
jgi:hypothetical protein